MLILRRKTGESFLIGDDVRVTIVATKDKEVQIAIDAPK
ncbi:MAG: carbon storage regulator, partial [Acutalibacter sp.]|nr:carbon storage regulator [Acutalibacter sp.]